MPFTSHFKSILLITALCLAVPLHAPAQQAEADTAKQEATGAQAQGGGGDKQPRRRRGARVAPPVIDNGELEEVVVIGEYIEGSGGNRRRSAASREELDRADETSMEDFFDDIDGLSTLGGDEQGNSFSIDGLSPDLSNVTLNGENFGEGRGSGGLRAGDLPPDMIRRVEVFRIPTATLEEGGSGGSVNLQLRNPVEIAGPTFSARGRLGYVPATEKFSPSATFFTGGPSESKKFGYMLSLTASERDRGYGSQDISDWDLRDFDGRSAYMPAQVRNNVVNDQQRTAFAGLTLGFRPRPSLDLGASIFLNQKHRGVVTHALQHRFEKQRALHALAFDGRIVSELDSSDKSRRNLRIVGSEREDLTDSLILGINLNWRRSGWHVDGALSYKSDNTESDSPSRSAVFEANSAFGYRAAADDSLPTSYAGEFPENQDFLTGNVSLNERDTEDVSRVAGLDVTRMLRGSFIRRIRFGAKAREMTRDRESSKARASLGEGQTLEDYFSGIYRRTPWDTVAWPSSSLGALDEALGQQEIDWEDNLLNTYDIERRTNAAYVQADFRTSEERQRFMVGNIGLRLVDTDTWIEGYQDNGEGTEPVSLKTSYTDVLPSLGARIRVADRSALSLGAAKVMTHPSFNDLAPGIRVNYADRTGRAGNPYLEPFRADQYLAELTWAPMRGQRLTVNLVYRDVESYFALGEESVEIADEVFLVTRPVNGEDGYILTAGVKLQQNLRRLHRRLQNISVQLSYTHNESSTEMRDPYTGEKLPMPNTAEQVARANLEYSKDRFAGKLTYQWRGRSLKASISDSGLSVWNEGYGSLNFNLGWKLSEALQFSLDGRNLLDEEQVRTTDDKTQLWRITERDRSVNATLRAKW
jgi:iron complex outermembrane receptor protein